ncbi:MAG: hypothetical protein Q7R73_05290 [bacterium]|nr:hypothetical protein [bacterium]
MEQNKITEEETNEEKISSQESDHTLARSIVLAALILAGAWVYTASPEGAFSRTERLQKLSDDNGSAAVPFAESVAPKEGVMLPVRWNDLGAKMVSVGVIDENRFRELYAARGGLGAEGEKLLSGTDNGNLAVTEENAGVILNLLWALGLGTKNDILTSGPMMDARYGGAGNFASTGGWTLAEGNAMEHYGRHPFIILTLEQQQLVERVAKNIYRPCCNNATYFPDCNHGMAMLGFLELMASQGVSEDEMYKAALKLNAFWFPDAYMAIAGYLESIGSSWDAVSPKELLGAKYSSASGYVKILEKFDQGGQQKNGSGCGVEGDAPPASGGGGNPGCGV